MKNVGLRLEVEMRNAFHLVGLFEVTFLAIHDNSGQLCFGLAQEQDLRNYITVDIIVRETVCCQCIVTIGL